MNELEQYIRTHAAEFDTEEPAPGHEARFLARLDSPVKPANDGMVKPAELSFRAALSSFWAKTRNLFRPAPVIAFALAALAAAFLIIRPGDPFRGVGNDPEAIYLAYMDRVAQLYRTLPCADSELRDATLADITEEEEPLFTQLPEELSDRQRGRILKDHYGRILAAAGQIKY